MFEVGTIPPSMAEAVLVSDVVTSQILDAATNASAVQLWYDQYLPPAVAQVHLNTCQDLFGLTITPEEAGRQFEQAMESYILEH